MTYPNFEFSFKKSAAFSCLFTFFQMRKENWQLFTTFWEFHMFWQKSDICLNFHTNNKIDQKIFGQKCLQICLLYAYKISVEISNGNLFNSHITDKFINIFVQKIFWSILLLVWKLKQTSDFCQTMWNSQYVIKSCQFFYLVWKNVNKQLISADFLKENLKFW